MLLCASSCIVVLNLDAEGTAEGASSEGASSEGGSGAGNTGAGDTGAGNTAGASCQGQGFATFDGESDFFQIDTGETLDLSNDFAIGARVRAHLSDVADGYVGVLFSRLSSSEGKGYSLYVFESDGQVFPGVSAYVNAELCSCVGTTPMTEAWTTVVGTYKRSGGGDDLRLFVEGTQVCTDDCGDDDLATFAAAAAIGSALNGNGYFFAGDLDDVFARRQDDPAVPSSCDAETRLLLRFDGSVGQVFQPDCGSEISVTQGASTDADTSDPTLVICP